MAEHKVTLYGAIMHVMRNAGVQVEWTLDMRHRDDAAENGGKSYTFSAVDTDGQRFIVKGPYLTLTLIALAERMGFDLEE